MMTLKELNNLPLEEATEEFTKCCGARNWVNKMIEKRPYEDFDSLLGIVEKIWFDCAESDWIEAFTHHPKIGDIEQLEKKFSTTKEWAHGEQKGVSEASREIIGEFSRLNTLYEEKFGFIFIVCATGKSAEEMLQLLMSRIDNVYKDELKIAMGEQHKITIIRLKKLLS